MPIAIVDRSRWSVKPGPRTPLELEPAHWLAQGDCLRFAALFNGWGGDPVVDLVSGQRIALQSGWDWAFNPTAGIHGLRNQSATEYEITLARALGAGEAFAVIAAGAPHKSSTGNLNFGFGGFLEGGAARQAQLRIRNQAADQFTYRVFRGGAETLTVFPADTGYETDTGARWYLTAGASLSATDHRIYSGREDAGRVFAGTGTDATSVVWSDGQLDSWAMAGTASSPNNISDFQIGAALALTAEMFRDLLREPYAWVRPAVRRTIFIPTAAGGTPVSLTAGIGDATAAGQAATPAIGHALVAGIGDATAAGLTAGEGVGVGVTAGIGDATAAGLATDEGVGVGVTAGIGNAAAAGVAPGAVLGVAVTASIGNAAAAGLAATISTGSGLPAPAGRTVSPARSRTVSPASNRTVSPGLAA